MDEKRIYIVYGSQTGNSEYIAKDLSSKLNDLNIVNTCGILNTIKKVDLRNSAKLLIIICSTTGNGDCPENADLWWRSIKIRSAAKDTFQDIPYHVLGLGDTNYDKFCYIGKSIDKRLNELGGKRFLELCCADEAVGLDEVIESWKIRILQYITNCTSSNDTKLNDNVNLSHAYSSETKETLESIDSKSSADTYSIIQNKLADGLFNITKICEHLNLQNILVNPPEANLLPKRKNESVNNLLFNVTITEKLKICHDDGWTQENPFTAEVTNAKWLTNENSSENPESSVQWGDSKRVIHVDISIANSNIDYQPGDCIGICCPNPNFAIEIVYNRLKIYHNNENLTLESIIFNSSSGEYLSLNDILTNRLDLTGPLRKGSVIHLLKYCREIEDSNFISWLCSNSVIGKQLWNEFVESQALGLAELLELIPSCYPPLHILLSFQQLAPRFYSIASSPLAYPATVSIAFSVERYCTGVTNSAIKLRRYGLCTTYLENQLQQYLNNSAVGNNFSPVHIRIFHKATINFKMPGSLAHPMILIGPGTGISPFIGFLQHREHSSRERMHSGDDISTGFWRGGFELNENDLPSECNHVGQYIQSVDVGSIYLFFGCRNSNDYLYKDDLEYYHRIGVIAKLEVAFSRTSNEKVYVTHKIIDSGKLLCDLIVNSGAYIYICGDGNHMAKSVYAAFKNILIDHNNMSDKEATDFIEELKHRRRYLLDIWS
mmetsp:Transcript_15661/g.14176  ORF Transcript_15661/g.14176 Transcript_15661/m.14176 type:complete len:718 (-) Transcript_15661:928-3081(-)